jgi:hypothetical protein
MLGLFGCKDEEAEPQKKAPEDDNLVYIMNEGNFGWGEATITAYHPDSMKTYPAVYQERNNQVLGNVVQSATRIGDQIAWVINNSGKVVITDKNLNHRNEIAGLRSPRMLIKVDDHLVISDLYRDAVYVVDASSLKIEKEVPIPGWTEEMVQLGDEVWVTCPESEYVYIIQKDSWTLEDSVKVGMGNHSIVSDSDGRLWCRYFGEFGAGKDTAGIVRVNPESREVTPVLSWEGEQQLPVFLSLNHSADTVYTMQKGNVLRFSVSNPGSTELLVEANGRNAYAFRFEPNSGNIYYSDVLDFVTPSMIYRYDDSGELLDQFEAGIVATDFLF